MSEVPRGRVTTLGLGSSASGMDVPYMRALQDQRAFLPEKDWAIEMATMRLQVGWKPVK